MRHDSKNDLAIQKDKHECVHERRASTFIGWSHDCPRECCCRLKQSADGWNKSNSIEMLLDVLGLLVFEGLPQFTPETPQPRQAKTLHNKLPPTSCAKAMWNLQVMGSGCAFLPCLQPAANRVEQSSFGAQNGDAFDAALP